MISVLIVEDQTIVREGLERLLAFAPEIKVIGVCASGAEALNVLKQQTPDIVLLDIQMPGMSGFDLIEIVRQDRRYQSQKQPKYIMLTTFNDAGYLMQAKQLALNGYLLKDVSLDQLVSSITRVSLGESVFPKVSEAETVVESLTPREREIFAKICEGMANKEVARYYSLSEGTVKNHVSNILSKLGVRDRAQAIVKYGVN
ncbi:MAG: response regulator transcription factor [Pseudomonadales bacterium]|nr:response regulator transcription factor [Pseudomonadales bacterium]